MKKWLQRAFVLLLCAMLFIQPVQITAQTGPDGVDYLESVEEAAEELREQMKLRNMEITVSLTTQEDIYELPHKIFAQALAHTGEPTEGDYLAHQHGGATIQLSGYMSGGVWYVTYTYQMNEYFSTAQEEQELDAAVAELLEELDLDEATDYDKIRTVYDWITENVVYDYEHLEDESYRKQFTPYAAMIHGTSVCQGYALLMYRLMLELGVDCRYISGDAGGRHGWNIVELDGQYYNLDVTWDSSYRQAGLDYAYFLKCPTSFGTDHTRDAAFETADFHAEYPMAAYDYCPVEWLKLGDVIIINGVTGVTVEELLRAIGRDGYINTADDQYLDPEDVVGTGMVFYQVGSGPSLEWPIVVAGDINGDGYTSVTDLMAIRSHLVDRKRLEGLNALGADINLNGTVTVTDLLQIKERILESDDR